MALVNCPECGKINVSDTAVSCPDCGFAIKDYYDKIKLEEQRLQEEKAQQEKREAEERHRRETAGERKKETISRLEKQIENSSKEIRNGTIGLCISLPLAILSFALSSNGSLGFIIVISVIAVIFSFVFVVSGTNEKKTAINDLETAKRNLDEYEKNQNARIEAMVAQGQVYAAKNAAKHPKCPICGSTNTERISTLNRTVSVATVGLASSKIGKQYQCKNCKHKW